MVLVPIVPTFLYEAILPVVLHNLGTYQMGNWALRIGFRAQGFRVTWFLQKCWATLSPNFAPLLLSAPGVHMPNHWILVVQILGCTIVEYLGLWGLALYGVLVRVTGSMVSVTTLHTAVAQPS